MPVPAPVNARPRSCARRCRSKCRSAIATSVLALIAIAPPPAAAASRLFAALAKTAMVCEIDPLTGAELSSFMTPGPAHVPGLAFNGAELFYTDETLPVVKVYTPEGIFLRDIAMPGAVAAGGLGVSPTSLFGVAEGSITAVDPRDGSPQRTFGLAEANAALTFAGPRGTLFVRVGDDPMLVEVTVSGVVLNTFATPLRFEGLAYSSARRALFGIADGTLYALDPDIGAVLPGYPVTVTDADGNPVNKTGALAADEICPGPCDEVCGNCVDEDEDGLVDFEDPDCCPAPVSMQVTRGRFLTGKRGLRNGRFRLRSILVAAGLSAVDPRAAEVHLQMRDGRGELLCAPLGRQQWVKKAGRGFVFRDPAGVVAHGLNEGRLWNRRNGGLGFRAASSQMDLSPFRESDLTVTLSVGNRCASSSVPLRRRSKGFVYP